VVRAWPAYDAGTLTGSSVLEGVRFFRTNTVILERDSHLTLPGRTPASLGPTVKPRVLSDLHFEGLRLGAV
jgi:hypothetical protein